MFYVSLFYLFDKFEDNKFISELMIQRIIGTISRGQIQLESKEDHLRFLDELLPEDYEKFLPSYLERVDSQYHEKINLILNEIKQFRKQKNKN